MSYSEQEKHRVNFLNTLETNNGIIQYTELLQILDAFQIASGQSLAIGKSKALLGFLKDKKEIVIKSFNHSLEEKIITTPKDLAAIFNQIDSNIRIENDKYLKNYFS